MGLLGAELKRDAATGFYKIVKVLHGEGGDSKLRSPLTDIGVDAKEGDYILAVNGRPTSEMHNIYQSLIDTAGKQVTLKINAEPKEQGGMTRWSCRSPPKPTSFITIGSRPIRKK